MLTIPGSRSYTFQDIDALAGRFAGGLLSFGIQAGDRVVLHLPNGWEWIVAYHAIARVGAVVVPANIMLSPDEIEFITSNSEARALIIPADRLISIRISDSVLCLTSDPESPSDQFTQVLTGEYREPCSRTTEDLFTIGYTSGTTGRPKGAMLSHGNVYSSISATATMHVRHAGDSVLSSLPFSHVYGNIVMNAAFLAGTRLVATPRFDPAEAIRLIAQERITLFEGVPTMYYQMLVDSAMETGDFSSLTRCTVGGQTMPTAKIEEVVARLGCPLLELWGMTEVSGPAVTHSPYWRPRHGSIGLPAPGVEVRIADLHNPAQEVPLGEPGELYIRGPSVMAGYWRNPVATSATLDEIGWLATGDMARRDEDSYLFIVDRRTDLIITAGFNIYPAELERVISAHEAVAMVAVVGVPDEEKGELAVAFVVRKSSTQCDEATLLAHCKSQLAAYKMPRIIKFVDDLPKTSTGKIMRRTLRERIKDDRAQTAENGEAS